MEITPIGTPVNVRFDPSITATILGQITFGNVITVDNKDVVVNSDYAWRRIVIGEYAGHWVAWRPLDGAAFWREVTPPPPNPEPVPCPENPDLVLVNEWAQLDRNMFSWDSADIVKVVGRDVRFDFVFIDNGETLSIFVIAEGGDLTEVKLNMKDVL